MVATPRRADRRGRGGVRIPSWIGSSGCHLDRRKKAADRRLRTSHPGYIKTSRRLGVNVCERLERELACRTASVGAGRRWVSGILEGWGVRSGTVTGAAHDDAVLATSELVAGAVRDCTRPLVLALVVHRDRITIDVTEEDAVPAGVTPSAVITAVSRRWGVEVSGSPGATRCRRWCEIGMPGGGLHIGCKLAFDA